MNFSKKCISVLLAAVCLCTACTGCSYTDTVETNELQSTETVKTGFFKKLPGKLNDDVLICANQADINIIKDFTASSDYCFDIISSEPLKESDIKVDIDNFDGFRLTVDSSVETKGKFSEELCLKYNRIDNEAYEKQKDEIDREYESLKDDLFPTFFTTKCTVGFNLFSIVGLHIGELKVTVKGKPYDIKIGDIYFTENQFSSQSDDLSFMNFEIVNIT